MRNVFETNLPILVQLFFLALVCVAPAAAQTIYRCEQDGKITFTDYPCEQPMIQESGPGASKPDSAVTQAIVGGGYEKPYGPWRGQAQYQVTNTRLNPASTHFVAPLIIQVADDGKVEGRRSESGERMQSAGHRFARPDPEDSQPGCDGVGLSRERSQSAISWFPDVVHL